MTGGYCRLEDFTKYDKKTKKSFYLDINGNDARNYKDEKGKQHGHGKAKFNEDTHFRILHLWEIINEKGAS